MRRAPIAIGLVFLIHLTPGLAYQQSPHASEAGWGKQGEINKDPYEGPGKERRRVFNDMKETMERVERDDYYENRGKPKTPEPKKQQVILTAKGFGVL